jgi:hypothetical protein
MASTRFINGKGSKIIWFLDGVKDAPLDVKNYDFGPVVDAIADGVNGEETERVDREIKHYAGKITCFNVDPKKLAALLKYDQQMAYLAGGQAVDVGFQITDKQGTKIKVSATEVVIDDWKWTSAGFTDRSMIDIPIRSRNMSAI